MDVEKLIYAAESCKYRRNCEGCPGKIGNKGCILNGSMEKVLLDAKAHYEALIKAERAKVVQEVREWASIEISGYDLYEKLDSMEDKTNV